MKTLIVTVILLIVNLATHAQKMTFDELMHYCNSDYTDIEKSLKGKGWKFHYIKNNENFKTYIWYHTGIVKQKSDAPAGKEVNAKFWFKVVYSNTTSYRAIDYQMNHENYSLYDRLSAYIKGLNLSFLGAEPYPNKTDYSYTDGTYMIDLIEETQYGSYGVMISKK